MEATATAGILRHFHDMTDPRRHNRIHKLIDILTIALFAVLSGAEGWVDVAEYGRRKLSWLKTFLELPGGIPSHDTFGKVFARLNPEEFERCFIRWMNTLVELGGGNLVAIDGKSLRRSFAQAWDKSGMAHMVSAFVAANRMVFAQIKTEGKGQELDAVEQLLTLLDLQGAVVSIDALGCNRNIAQKIVDAKADYVLQVKENQPTLHRQLENLLDEALLEKFAGLSHDVFEQVNGDHGRIETRRVWITWDVQHLGDLADEWPEVRSLLVVESRREVAGQASNERHYYISTLGRRSKAQKLAGHIRGHWTVENNLHWQLDVSFREDDRRIRKGYGAENFSRLCRMSLNLLKNEQSLQVGIAGKRKNCGWSNEYLLKALGQ